MTNQIKHHPREWWDDQQYPERNRLLRDVIREPLSDSEDEMGRPVFKARKCQEFQDYLLSLEEEKIKVEQ